MGKKKKKEILPGIELIIIVVFFLSFTMWAISKCNQKKLSYAATISSETDSTILEKIKTEETPVQEMPVSKIQDSIKKHQNSHKAPSQPSSTPVTRTIIEKYTPLYVSVDSLKLRAGPGLQHNVILKMPLHTELTFLHEVSDSTHILNIGDRIVNEPWIKVKHPKGHIGWVYGGYIDFYKKIYAPEN